MFNSTQAELIFSTFIVGLVVACLRYKLLAPARLNFFDLALFSSGVFFGLGPWIAFVSGGWTSLHNDRVPLEPVDVLFNAYLVIGSYMLSVWLSGWFVVHLHKDHTIRRSSELRFSIVTFFRKYEMIPWRLILVVIGTAWILRVIVGVNYGIFFSGTASMERVLSLPYYIVILRQLSEMIVKGCLLWACMSFWSHRHFLARRVALCALVSEFFWAFLKGRRWMLIWLVFVFFGFVSSRHKLRPRHILIFVLVLGFAFTVVFPFFVYVRFIYFVEPTKDANAVQHFGEMLIAAPRGSAVSLEELYKKNMKIRPLFPRTFICRICEGLDSQQPMMGAALLRTFLRMIPSAIVRNKVTYLACEQFIQKHFHYPLHDESITWPAVGCADFGTVGGACAGMVLSFWILLMLRWSQVILVRHPLVAYCLIGGIMDCLLQFEQGPIANWILARNVLIVLVIVKLSNIFKLSRSHPAKPICVKGIFLQREVGKGIVES